MIYSYKISNFKSIKKESQISFKASSLKSKESNLINNKILPVISIYGPNGGGKTSLISSLIALSKIVRFGNDIEPLCKKYTGLRNYERKNEPMNWEISFINEENEIFCYELSISDFINYEKLSFFKKINSKPKIIFERKNNELINCCKQIKDSKIKFDNVISTYLYFISNILNIEEITYVISEFKKIITFDSIVPLFFENKLFFNNLDYTFINKHKKEFIKIFEETDINIVDFEIIDNSNDSIIFNLLKKNSWNKNVKIAFSEESKGTQKFIETLSFILKNIYNGSYFIVDELDSSLHTKLLGYIIKIFTKGNFKSQLLFTSHDIGTLSSEYFRKDEIYFAALNESGFTNLVCLNDFDLQIRNKSSYSNIYLSGKIGYDPYIQYGLEWVKNEKK